MSTIRISDITLKQKAAEILSFKEKIELVKLVDKLHVDVIELTGIRQVKADSLFIKTVCQTVSESTICVEALPDKYNIDTTWKALQNAHKARLQISAPVSLVQMEYLNHKKPEAVIKDVVEAVSYAKTLTDDVEFKAVDATRSEKEFLYDILNKAVDAGATTVTVCDTAGNMLPQEFGAFIEEIHQNVDLKECVLGVSCNDEMAMADACSVAAMIAGSKEVKVSIYPDGNASLKNVASILQKKGSEYDLVSNIRTVELKRICETATRMFTDTRSKTSPFDTGVRESGFERYFTINDDITAIIKETEKLGYDLMEEDQIRVYEEFKNIAAKKDQVSEKEIDAIVASNALQVPATYEIENYIINCCNVFSASAHLRLKKNGSLLESVAIGDGPVDAAFLAVEQIVGMHYELDDFQIRAVTEVREAMGETIVKLRSKGRIYSGRGLATDIVGSSISAYVNALNKIVYEEAE